MEMIEKKIKELEIKKDNLLKSYPDEDGEMQTMLAMQNMELSLQIKFLRELNDVISAKKPVKEFILASACWYDDGQEHVHQPTNIKIGYITAGQRHHNCIGTFAQIAKFPYDAKALKIMRTEVQGFLTNKNRFVDRKEAYKIAFDADQIIGPNKGDPENSIGLTSEDLY